MAITAADHIRVLGPTFGTHTPLMHLTRATSVAFKRGDTVAIASGVAAASASPVVTATFGGFVNTKETASVGSTCQITPARPGIRFMGKINTSSSSSQLKQAHLLAKAAIKKYTSSSANVYTVDPNFSSSNSKSKCVIITRLIDAVSTVNGWVEFEITNNMKPQDNASNTLF